MLLLPRSSRRPSRATGFRCFMEWRPVVGYEGLYEVSELGDVRSVAGSGHLRDGRTLKQGITRSYYAVCLYDKHTRATTHVHRIVADAFIPNPHNYPQVNHKNGIKTDNRAANLEWVTVSQNHKHAYETGLRSAKGEFNGRAKLFPCDILGIRESVKTQKELAAQYGVRIETISKILLRKRWGHIP